MAFHPHARDSKQDILRYWRKPMNIFWQRYIAKSNVQAAVMVLAHF